MASRQTQSTSPQSEEPHGSGAGQKPSRCPGEPVPAETRREILREVAAGRKAVAVAREYGVSAWSISNWKREQRQAAFSPVQRPPEVTAPPPPRETGRYSQAFKQEVLSQVLSGRKIVEVARQYSVPEGTIGRWRREAKRSGGELPQPQSTRPSSSGPSPINEEHRRLVLALKEKHPNMGLAQVQNQLRRFEALKLSRHMIGRIFKEAGIPLQKRVRKDADPSDNRFEMTRPNELWAVDFKEIWIHSEKAQALFVLDDFSRFLLGFALTQKPTADLAIQTVEQAIGRYGRPERVLSDRGPQFHAWNGVSRFDEYLADFLTDHTVTKARHAFTNGKLEAFNRSLEAEVLDVEEFTSLQEAEEKIRAHIARYNYSRTHMGIAGLVPADRYFGMVEEAQRALHDGLEKAGAGLRWLQGLVGMDGAALRDPVLLGLVAHDKKLEIVALGRRFTIG
jgi:transposase InsO family protein